MFYLSTEAPRYVTKYFAAHGLYVGEYVECECGCGREAKWIHHIDPRGMGGAKRTSHYFANLLAVCDECHRLCDASQISRAEQRAFKTWPPQWFERLEAANLLDPGETRESA
jgi:hypothetical protein